MVRPLKRMSSHSSYILTGLEKRMGVREGLGWVLMCIPPPAPLGDIYNKAEVDLQPLPTTTLKPSHHVYRSC